MPVVFRTQSPAHTFLNPYNYFKGLNMHLNAAYNARASISNKTAPAHDGVCFHSAQGKLEEAQVDVHLTGLLID